MSNATAPATPDTLITLKILIEGSNRRIKLPLRDLTVKVLPDKLRSVLNIPHNQNVIFERFSDSSASYITLDPQNSSAYKQLFRAAKAKLKLRIKVTLLDTVEQAEAPTTVSVESKAAETCVSEAKPVPALVNGGRAACARPSPIGKCEKSSTSVPQPQVPVQAQAQAQSEVSAPPARPSAWVVFCNNCEEPMKDAHYHCSICEFGDYDLCEKCVANGIVCKGQNHWLIRRFVRNGQIVNSCTERIAPKSQRLAPSNPVTVPVPVAPVAPQKLEESKPDAPDFARLLRDIPGSFGEDAKSAASKLPELRTCNSCVKIFPEHELVCCIKCPDYDLCKTCLVGGSHGHHPAHEFEMISETTGVFDHANSLLPAGRGFGHDAICDGCENPIRGVRHKCLDCPDWDYCADCFIKANETHPIHRFVPLYDRLPAFGAKKHRHIGIYCDGPLCNTDISRNFIRGHRYKCAVCADTDFCASCHAHPLNKHNVTHPMILFKTPVWNCSVTTINQDSNSQTTTQLGDNSVQPVHSTTTSAAASQCRAQQPKSENADSPRVRCYHPTPSSTLDAIFVKDTIPDGTTVAAAIAIEQSWTLRNPSKNAWPKGCRVEFIGGDQVIVGASQDANEASPKCSNEIEKAIEQDESATFTVAMRFPLAQGRHISYWRLVTPSGEPFGHKLWCDVHISDSIYEATTTTRSIPEPAEAELSSSQMVFPTLDKESPSSSTYQDAPATISASVIDVPASIATKSIHSEAPTATEQEKETETELPEYETIEHTDREDEDITVDDDSDTEADTGFLTDEEYDILDASDEELSHAE